MQQSGSGGGGRRAERAAAAEQADPLAGRETPPGADGALVPARESSAWGLSEQLEPAKMRRITGKSGDSLIEMSPSSSGEYLPNCRFKIRKVAVKSCLLRTE